MSGEPRWENWEDRARGAVLSFRHHDGHELHCRPGTDHVAFSAQCGALIERIDRHDERINRLRKTLDTIRAERNAYCDRLREARQEMRIDGDVLFDVIAAAFPRWLSQDTAQEVAERAVSELARTRGPGITPVTVLRGTHNEPWMPDEQQPPDTTTDTADAAVAPDTADDGANATIVGDGWTEYGVLVGSYRNPTVVADGYDDAEAASELGQHVPAAWLGRRQVVTDGWSLVT